MDNAWLIPLLPGLAFALIALILRRTPAVAAAVSITAIIGSFITSLLVIKGVLVDPAVYEYGSRWFTMPGLNAEMGILLDPIAAVMLLVVTLVAMMVQVYSLGYMRGDPGYPSYFAYQSLFAASMLGLVLANNFLQLFVFWELVGLCSYLLIGFWFGKPEAREAAKKAFVTNRVGDFGFLLGILLLQIVFGTLNFVKLQPLVGLYESTALLTGLALLIFTGPIGKSAQFPLHVWLPDAMEGPTPVSALIHAATMVVAGVYLVARAFFLFAAAPKALLVVAYLGGFTALFAATIALTQNDIKRILAYSTLSQLGYMIMALGVGSLTAGMFHLMTHAFFKALLFLGAGSVIHALHGKQDIWEMGGLTRRMPVTTGTFIVGALALAGIFPLAGFWSKDEILSASLANGYTGLYIVGSLVAFLTAFYMFRLVFVAFMKPARPENHPHESPLTMTVPLVILGVLSVVGGLVGLPWLKVNFATYIHFGEVHHGANLAVMAVSTLLALAGIGLAYLMYYRERIRPEAVLERFPALYRLFYHKYYIDEIYQYLIDKLVDGTARVLYWADVHLVDGAVNGAGRLAQLGGLALRLTQTGRAQHYALVLVAVVVVMVLAFGLINPSLVISLGGGGLAWLSR
ncbi:MAG: NADH-quinone oxidoreductase subunit L [Firmicutes bacterium]|nr:NADH-quinone oxidoreductase subunit L [Bacillota bacterium]